MDIRKLLELARARRGVKSDRALCRELGITSAAYIRYRDGDGVPNDETMLRLSDAAGISPEHGLLLANMWRSKGRARATYSRVVKMVVSADDHDDNKKAA